MGELGMGASILGTILAAVFIVIWVVDGIRMAAVVLAVEFGIIAASTGIVLFWYWVWGIPIV